MQKAKPYIIAHRGASGHAPENTMAAIKLAVQMGADMVEIDVRQTFDGVLVCLHDASVRRTTNGKGYLSTFYYKSLKKLDAGSWFGSEFQHERIPSLNEVLQYTKTRCKLLIEVKGDQVTQLKIAKRLVEVIKKHDAYGSVIVQSFNPAILRATRRLDKRVEINQLIYFQHSTLPIFSARLPTLGYSFKRKLSSGVNPSSKNLSEEFLQKMRKAGKHVFCWTVNDKEEMEKLVTMGVDGIITNYPDRLVEVLKETEKIES